MKPNYLNNFQRDIYPYDGGHGVTAMELNKMAQQKASNDAFKKQARETALRTALSNKPSISYMQGLGSLGQGQQQPHYDLLGEAEKIYNWLIKDIEIAQSQS